MTVYRYPRLVEAHLLLARSRTVWAAAVLATSAAGFAVVLWGPSRLSVAATIASGSLCFVIAAAQVTTCLAVKPWERLPMAVGADGWGLHLFEKRSAYRRIRWDQVGALKQDLTPLWLLPYCVWGAVSLARVDFGQQRPGCFYILPNMIRYAEVIELIRGRIANVPRVRTYTATIYAKVLYYIGTPLIAVCAWVLVAHANEPHGVPASVLVAWFGLILVVALAGLLFQAYGLAFTAGWIEIRKLTSRHRVPDADLISLDVRPLLGYAVLRWKGGRAIISSTIIDKYGDALAEIRARLGGDADAGLSAPSLR
jgi:hypothetical protein